MNITITKKNGRNQLMCERSNGSVDMANLGPSLPYHDLAHFVAERTLGIANGFFGNVASGYSMSDLADEAVIRSLGDEAWQAEIAARAVGSLATGACTASQFEQLINSELEFLRIDRIEGIDCTGLCQGLWT